MGLKVNQINEISCELLVFNYVDMGIKKGKASFIYNLISRRFFIPLYKKIENKFVEM